MKKYLERYKSLEASSHMIGWDFSKLKNTLEDEKPCFDYLSIVDKYRTDNMLLLDMETGGGEVLLKINHPFNQTAVTEGYKPNVMLCRERLEPKGIKVIEAMGDASLPFDDQSFDIITNRHGSFNPNEINRVLKPGGFFITQQVGPLNNLPLRTLINRNNHVESNHFMAIINLFKRLDFNVVEFQETFPKTWYKSIDAVIYMAKMIAWEFPKFNVENAYDQLVFIEDLIHQQGFIESFEHRYYFVAKKT